MQAGPGGFGSGPEGDAVPVVARIIAVGRFIGPASWHRAE
jgi:hypothetical protein